MEELIALQQLLLDSTKNKYQRYLLSEIDWSNRLIGIKGARGTGKTTILLQRLKEVIKTTEAMYVSLDNLYFLENTLFDFAKQFSLLGGTHLFLDEVHKYPRWSREIKLVYDHFPNLQIVFTSSSILEIHKGESDLSRRAVIYALKELSFREFILFKKQNKLPKIKLEELLSNHKEIAKQVLNNTSSPVKEFKDYLEHGAYPYFLENQKSYFQKLHQTINLILEIDLNAVENLTYTNSIKIKKLLVAIAQSAPFTPNITKLSERLGITRIFLLEALKSLNKAELIIELHKPTTGVGALTKPEKIFLNNTNLMYALGSNQVEAGTLRETFFVNQMKHLYEIHLSPEADFLIERRYTFEVGGKNKKRKQIEDIKNSFIVRDDMEIGGLNAIPLYLFGLLY